MLDRRSRPGDIDWIVDMNTIGRLDLDPSYQRFSVWSLSYKQYFIDTILKNFPCPAIFLHKDTSDDIGPIYHVVDGKQRILAILDFMSGEFPISSNHEQHAGKYYDELDDGIQVQFGNYQLIFEIVTTKSIEDLREAFDRLNRNVRQLNKQELRHARHDGEFINLMENLAEEPFWAEIGIATPSRMRRMRDVEYISEIFLLTMHGVLDSSYKTIDRYYAEYDDKENFEKSKYLGKYRKTLEFMDNLGRNFLSNSRYSNLNDFYSLCAAIQLSEIANLEKVNYEQTKINLRNFDERVTSPEDIDPEDSLAIDYSNAVRQGANKPANRKLRAEILSSFIFTN